MLDVSFRSAAVTRPMVPSRYGTIRPMPDDQQRRALHVERAEAVESGERERDAEHRQGERADAQRVPQAATQEVADLTGERNRDERQAEKEAEAERRERAEATTMRAVRGLLARGGHAATAAP